MSKNSNSKLSSEPNQKDNNLDEILQMYEQLFSKLDTVSKMAVNLNNPQVAIDNGEELIKGLEELMELAINHQAENSNSKAQFCSEYSELIKESGFYVAKEVPSVKSPDLVRMYLRTDGYTEYRRVSAPETKQIKIDHTNHEILYNHLAFNDLKPLFTPSVCDLQIIHSSALGEITVTFEVN